MALPVVGVGRTTSSVHVDTSSEKVPVHQVKHITRLHVCDAGKLFGLHTGDGHTMWSLTFNPSTPPQHIFTWRVSHDIQHAPEILVLYSGQSSSSYSIVNAHTGQEVKTGSLAHPVQQVACDTVCLQLAVGQDTTAMLP